MTNQEVTLADGRRCRLRGTRPEDAQMLQRFVAGLSEESSHQRFFAPVHRLSPAMLERFTRIVDPREAAIVAEPVEGEPRIVGTARCLAGSDGPQVEFAVTVADAWQGSGLGTLLLRTLLGEVRAHGVRRVQGQVLAENERMLSIARKLGFSIRPEPGDAGLRALSLDFSDDPAADQFCAEADRASKR